MTNHRQEDTDDEPSSIKYKPVFCQSCGTEITSTQNIAAERFHGRLGAATLYKTAINITVMNTERRELLSGVYDVADVTCRNCTKVIGWYYYQVSNKSNEWKIGKYCLEDELASTDIVYKSFPAAATAAAAAQTKTTTIDVSSMMNMMSPAAVVSAVVRSSSKMMSSVSRENDDEDDDDEEDDDEVESESSEDDEDDVSVCSVGQKEEESDLEDESEQEDDVDEWEVVELIEMTA